ncbi:MAG: glutamate 5-kinase [Magnetococcales bacterium]|nr:glutamate 5-kinase [Magnetococcales bacterium]
MEGLSVSGSLDSYKTVSQQAAWTLSQEWEKIRLSRRIVIKIGSNLLTGGQKVLRRKWIEKRVSDIATLIKGGRKVVIVTSGSVAAGLPLLGLNRPPENLREKQAAAAAGQGILLNCYQEAFAKHNIHIGQVLLSRDDVSHRRRHLNARDTLETLLNLGLVPVVNENDTVVVEQLKFGDNDTLSANIADLIGADLLILLSDVDGLYREDPRHNPDAKLIPLVEEVTPEIEKLAGGTGSLFGSGGMRTKLKAAKMAARSGCAMVLTSGFRKDPIGEVFGEKAVGTLFLAEKNPLNSYKSWIANSSVVSGELVLDRGAVTALHKGKSLLAKGIVSVDGSFDRGDVVNCLDPDGIQVAKGIVHYNSVDLTSIAGCHSDDFESILGFMGETAIIHRNEMVIFVHNEEKP